MVRGLKPFHLRVLYLDKKKQVRLAGFKLITSSHNPQHLSRHLTRKMTAYIRVIFIEAADCHKTCDLLKDPLLLHRVYSESLAHCIKDKIVPHVTSIKMIKIGVRAKRSFQRFKSSDVCAMLCSKSSHNREKQSDIAMCSIVETHSVLKFKPANGSPCASSFYKAAFETLLTLNILPELAVTSQRDLENITLKYIEQHPWKIEDRLPWRHQLARCVEARVKPVHRKLTWPTMAHLDYTLLSSLRRLLITFTGASELIALNNILLCTYGEHHTQIHVFNNVTSSWILGSQKVHTPRHAFLFYDGSNFRAMATSQNCNYKDTREKI